MAIILNHNQLAMLIAAESDKHILQTAVYEEWHMSNFSHCKNKSYLLGLKFWVCWNKKMWVNRDRVGVNTIKEIG